MKITSMYFLLGELKDNDIEMANPMQAQEQSSCTYINDIT